MLKFYGKGKPTLNMKYNKMLKKYFGNRNEN